MEVSCLVVTLANEAGMFDSRDSPPPTFGSDDFPNYTHQPFYMSEPVEFGSRPYRNTGFDCSIQQLLSPVPYHQQLPIMTTVNDPINLPQQTFAAPTSDIFVKDEEEEEEESVGTLVRDLIPTRSSHFIFSRPEPEFINPQMTFVTRNMTIPQPLQPVTSPLLERNPAFRHLYHHFINRTCGALVPYDDQKNPFRTILAQMALHPSAQHLLAALLASSAAHRAGIKGEQPPKYLISNLLQTTLSGLRKALDNPTEASQDTTLATAIALSSYNIISSDVQHWRMHLDGAREIILHRRRTSPKPIHESSIHTFLFKWFAYLDVIAGASGLTLKEHNYDSAVSLIEDVTDTKGHESLGLAEIDRFTGFTASLLPILLRIGKLAHEKRTASRKGIDLTTNPEFIVNIMRLEYDLNTAELDTINFPPDIDAALEQQLRACNEAFHAAARLHVERRLRGMSSAQVRNTVEQVFTAIERVPEGCGPEISLLYPLFSAGVEATGERRTYAEYRMTEMEKIGIGNVQRAKRVMLETWEASKRNGSVQWEDVMEEMGWDLSLA
jgi:hypothetical protein